jgi:hypothetical protein
MSDADYLATIQDITNYFSASGWKTRKTRRGYISRKPGHHTKAVWSLYKDDWYINWRVELQNKTPHGGWAHYSSYYGDGNLASLIREAEVIPKPMLISKTSLPDPRVLKADNSSIVLNKEHRSVSSTSHLSGVVAEGIVGLEKDGSISKKAIYTPGEEVWFSLKLVDHQGTWYRIITNGEKYHPIKSSGKKRVTPENHFIMSGLTEIDGKLIEQAIGLLFNEEEEKEEID